MAQPGANQCQESSGQILNHKSNALPLNYPSFPEFHTECVLCMSPLKALHMIWEFWLAAEQAPPSLFYPSLHTRMHAHTHTHHTHAHTLTICRLTCPSSSLRLEVLAMAGVSVSLQYMSRSCTANIHLSDIVTQFTHILCHIITDVCPDIQLCVCVLHVCACVCSCCMH